MTGMDEVMQQIGSRRTALLERQRAGQLPAAAQSNGGWKRVLLSGWTRLVSRYGTRNERLHVCETVSLGGKRSVVLLECDGQQFLAGLSAQGVETLVPVRSTGRNGEAQ